MKMILYNVLILLLILLVAPLEAIYAEAGGIILIDRTGSMTVIRPVTGNTRCADARTTASVDVNAFFGEYGEYPNARVAVWTFAGTGYIDVTGGFTDKASALAAIQGLNPEGCDGLTPLADAMCWAADALSAAFPEGTRILYVSSDGGENNSSGECSGYDGLVEPWPDGSWQRNVLDKFCDNAIVNVRYWGSLEKDVSAYDLETDAPTSTSADDLFFSDLAYCTGGTYIYHDDGEEPGPALLVPSLTEWGLLILILLLLGLGVYVAYRRRARAV